jgi:hypothetical protein
VAYTLQAIVGPKEALEGVTLRKAVSCPLPQSQGLIVLTKACREEHGIAFLPLTDGGGAVPEAVAAACSVASRRARVAYVEAELFGGSGCQASIVWDKGEITTGPSVGQHAINQALLLLGVRTAPGQDEFDALGLGRHRDIEHWGALSPAGDP